VYGAEIGKLELLSADGTCEPWQLAVVGHPSLEAFHAVDVVAR